MILFLLFFPLTVAAYFILPMAILWNPSRFKEAMRAVDQFNNAFWLYGSGRESVSSHAWREKDMWWGKFVVWITDHIQPGHCQEANKLEQPIVDFINSRK